MEGTAIVLVGEEYEWHLFQLDLCTFEAELVVPHVGIDNFEVVGDQIFVHGGFDEDDPTFGGGWSHTAQVVDGWLQPIGPTDDAVFLGGTSERGHLLLLKRQRGGGVKVFEWSEGELTPRHDLDLLGGRVWDARPGRGGLIVALSYDVDDNTFRCEVALDALRRPDHRVAFPLEVCIAPRGLGDAMVVATVRPKATYVVDPTVPEVVDELPGWKALSWSPDGHQLLLADESGMLGIADSSNLNIVHRLGRPPLFGRVAGAAWTL